MKTLKKIWSWLVWSSQDPTKWSLTLKAGVPYILLMLSWNGLSVDGNAIQQFIDILINFIVSLVTFVSAGMALYGAGRKISTSIKKNSGI